jgi:hypothetical protein
MEGILKGEELEKGELRKPAKLGTKSRGEPDRLLPIMALFQKEMLSYVLQEELNILHKRRPSVNKLLLKKSKN